MTLKSVEIVEYQALWQPDLTTTQMAFTIRSFFVLVVPSHLLETGRIKMITHLDLKSVGLQGILNNTLMLWEECLSLGLS